MSKRQLEIKAYIGSRIGSLRSAAGYTQQQFADLMNMSRNSIINIETGRHSLTLVGFYKLCCIFQCTPNDIFPKVQKLKMEQFEKKIVKVIIKHPFKPVKL